MASETQPRVRDFWPWFWLGGGWRLVAGSWWWDFIYTVTGITLAFGAVGKLSALASTAALPFVSVIIATSFAFAVTAFSLAQTEELNEASPKLEEHILSFQGSFLVVFVATGLCGVASLGIFDSLVLKVLPKLHLSKPTLHVVLLIGRALFFTILASASRECWGMAKMAMKMTTSFVVIRRMVARLRDQQAAIQERESVIKSPTSSSGTPLRVELNEQQGTVQPVDIVPQNESSKNKSNK